VRYAIGWTDVALRAFYNLDVETQEDLLDLLESLLDESRSGRGHPFLRQHKWILRRETQATYLVFDLLYESSSTTMYVLRLYPYRWPD
jgi:hypothetical protein